MHKRILSMILAVLLLVGLSACGTAPDTQTDPTSATSGNTSETTGNSPVFEEAILVDTDDVTFKITAIEDDNLWGYTLKAYLENNTDKELVFSFSNTSVNGFMCAPLWAATVSAGMKANEEIHFSESDFQRNGITEVTDITFTLHIYDNGNWMADYLVDEEFTIYPMGEEAASPYVRTPAADEIVLFDDENCTMIVTGYDPDNTWGYTVKVYLENKTDKDLMFSLGDAAVNGFMCDPFWAETVAPGKRSHSEISWSAASFEENGITDVESLTLPIRVYDADRITTDALIEDTFTLNP